MDWQSLGRTKKQTKTPTNSESDSDSDNDSNSLADYVQPNAVSTFVTKKPLS